MLSLTKPPTETATTKTHTETKTINTAQISLQIFSFFFFSFHHYLIKYQINQLANSIIMRFSIATLSLAAFTVVSAGYISRGEGLTRGEKHERYECDFDSFEWKFGLAVKELKHHGDKNWGRDVELDLVYESDDGQLYHGCKDVYKASKCRNCYETFEFSDNESSDDEGSGSDCEDDECKKRKKKVHRNYKRGGYGSERRQSDCESDCERSERCNYPFCELYEDNCDLLLTLCDGVLHDDRHATGEIVANHQFQFDKPPQKDALHKKGFSIVYTHGNYYLALDNKIKFWHCKVDDNGLYKIYDKSIGEQCCEIELFILKSDKKAEFEFTDSESDSEGSDCDDDCKKNKKHGKKHSGY